MHRLPRLDGMLLERQLKNLGRRLRRMGQTGDGDGVEEIGDAQSPQDVEQPRVKIGDDAQFKSQASELSERRQHVRKQLPGNGISEHVEHMLEEFIEALEQTDTIKDIMHDIEPPQPFALFDLGGFCGRKDRRRRIVKGSSERLGDQPGRIRPRLIAELYGMPEIDVRNGSVHMEERLRSIEKHYSDRLAHSCSLAPGKPETGKENNSIPIAHLSAVFLTK